MAITDYKSTAEPKATAGGVPVFCAHDAIVEVEKLVPNPKNPNKHPEEQIALLGRIIKATGWRQPITVSNRSGFIVKGHGRLMAALGAGLTAVPVDYQEYTSEAEEYADLVADNRLAELSEIDNAMLADIFKELDEIPTELTGYTEEEASDLVNIFADEEINDQIEEDLVPEARLDADPLTRPGDIWQLGEHKLICGDSTKAETYAALMGGEKARLIITDPPYNVDYTGGTDKALKIKNDNMGDEAFRQFLTDAFVNMAQYGAPAAAVYVWHAASEGLNFNAAVKKAGIQLKQCLIWVKSHFSLGRQDYQWKHEPCLYCWLPGDNHYFIDDRKQTTVVEQEQLELNKLTKAELVAILSHYMSPPEAQTTVLYEKKPLRSDLHPTMKPIKLIARLMTNSSKRGWIVLDPFMGSGTTLITAEKTGRIARGIELDPYYCDVIVRRYILTFGAMEIKLIRNGKEQPPEVWETLLDNLEE